jgi:hypothetical protein
MADIQDLYRRIRSMDDEAVNNAVNSIEKTLDLDDAGVRLVSELQMDVGHSKRNIMMIGGDPYGFCGKTAERIKLFVYELFAARNGYALANYK